MWLFAARRDTLNPLSILNSTETKIQSKIWTQFPTSNMLKTSQTWSLNHCHLSRGRKYTPAPALRWSIALLSHGDAMLRVAFRRTYSSISTTLLRRVTSTDISSVGSRRRIWRLIMTTCWRKKTLLCVSPASKTRMVSRSSWLACQIIRLLWSGNYTPLRIWDGMAITDALSNTGVQTLSKAWDGWCGSQRMPSISFSPLSIALTAIRPRNASIPKFTLRTGGWRHR